MRIIFLTLVPAEQFQKTITALFRSLYLKKHISKIWTYNFILDYQIILVCCLRTSNGYSNLILLDILIAFLYTNYPHETQRMGLTLS